MELPPEASASAAVGAPRFNAHLQMFVYVVVVGREKRERKGVSA